MSSFLYDRLVPSAGVFTFDRLVDIVGVPTITAVSTVQDGVAITLTGTSFSGSGNAVFALQGTITLPLAVTAESTTSITTAALDTSGLKLTQNITLYMTNASGVASNLIDVTILPATGESAWVIQQTFLGDATTRGSASPDIAYLDEMRIRNVVGGVIGDVTVTGQGAFKAADAVTSFEYAIQDGTLLGAYALVTRTTPATTAAVPNVFAELEAQAIADILAASFVPSRVAQLPNAAVAAGRVLSQFPSATTQLVLGGTVEYTLSTGSGQVSVPIFIGTKREDAEFVRAMTPLTGQSYRLIDGNNSGYVVNQSVAPGTIVDAGAAVDIVYSSNLEPNVLGQLQQNGIAQLLAANLVVSDTVLFAYDTLYPAQTISSQSPPPDTIVAPGAVIQITVSLGRPPVTPGAPIRNRFTRVHE